VSDKRGDPSPYLFVRRGRVEIGATLAWEPIDPAARGVPQGVEVVLEVDDLVAERDALVTAGWPIAEDITRRPWGLTDFRVFDPDGNYLRFTMR
jgi:catechol 2,3-dioxygenase-like lactoylglutathione lyase family enzyme